VSVYGIALMLVGLLIGMVKEWSRPALAATLGAYLLQIGWIARAYDGLPFGRTVTILVVIFLSVLLWRIRCTMRGKADDTATLAAGIINSTAFTGMMVIVMGMEELSGYHGALLFGLAGLHALLGFIISSLPGAQRRDVDAWVLPGLMLAFIAVPVQLDALWVTVGWLALASVMMGIGILGDIASARRYAIPVFFISIGKVFLYDSSSFSEINRIISFLFLGVLLLTISFLWYRNRDRVKRFLS
jgi:hypothetical protein